MEPPTEKRLASHLIIGDIVDLPVLEADTPWQVAGVDECPERGLTGFYVRPVFSGKATPKIVHCANSTRVGYYGKII